MTKILPMEVLTLGSGQEVGRSCIIVTIENKTIMLDCGLHIGYTDSRRFPDFECLSKSGNFDKLIDCIIISHFHLDHTGALPYLTEILGYNGPIYMTHPTKAVLPILLEDCQRILAMRNKKDRNYTIDDIKNCMDKVIAININETVQISEGFYITPYYAGHVIGAAMFHVKVGKTSLVYTGDYSTTPDQHLATASIDALYPDLMITESTYGSIIRDCRKSREREFLKSIHQCLDRSGKVLIPIAALGRAQEICLIVDSYWNRLGLKFPIYFAGGLTEKANEIYKRFINYTNDQVRERIHHRNAFEFKSIKPYFNGCEADGPCVIFSSPGMLSSGHSLRIFTKLCSDKRNLVILPGYSVRGTLGDRILNGSRKERIQGMELEIDIEVKNIAFSAHADTLGIMKIINECKPKNLMLVHGEKIRMKALRNKIIQEYRIPVFMPANGTLLKFRNCQSIPLQIDKEVFKNFIDKKESEQQICLIAKIEKTKEGVSATELKEFITRVEGSKDIE